MMVEVLRTTLEILCVTLPLICLVVCHCGDIYLYPKPPLWHFDWTDSPNFGYCNPCSKVAYHFCTPPFSHLNHCMVLAAHGHA